MRSGGGGGWTDPRSSGPPRGKMLHVREQTAEAPGTGAPESTPSKSRVSGVQAVLGTPWLLGPPATLPEMPSRHFINQAPGAWVTK